VTVGLNIYERISITIKQSQSRPIRLCEAEHEDDCFCEAEEVRVEIEIIYIWDNKMALVVRTKMEIDAEKKKLLNIISIGLGMCGSMDIDNYDNIIQSVIKCENIKKISGPAYRLLLRLAQDKSDVNKDMFLTFLSGLIQ
jgi:hypothetical protein